MRGALSSARVGTSAAGRCSQFLVLAASAEALWRFGCAGPTGEPLISRRVDLRLQLGAVERYYDAPSSRWLRLIGRLPPRGGDTAADVL